MIPLDSAFKCTRLHSSYLCLSCRIKLQSTIPTRPNISNGTLTFRKYDPTPEAVFRTQVPDQLPRWLQPKETPHRPGRFKKLRSNSANLTREEAILLCIRDRRESLFRYRKSSNLEEAATTRASDAHALTNLTSFSKAPPRRNKPVTKPGVRLEAGVLISKPRFQPLSFEEGSSKIRIEYGESLARIRKILYDFQVGKYIYKDKDGTEVDYDAERQLVFHVIKQDGTSIKVREAEVRKAEEVEEFWRVLQAHAALAKDTEDEFGVGDTLEVSIESNGQAAPYRLFGESEGDTIVRVAASPLQDESNEFKIRRVRSGIAELDRNVKDSIVELPQDYPPHLTEAPVERGERTQVTSYKPFVPDTQPTTRSSVETDLSETVAKGVTDSKPTSSPSKPERKPQLRPDPVPLPSIYTSYARPMVHGLAPLSQTRPRLIHTSAQANLQDAAAATAFDSDLSPDVIFTTAKPHKYSQIRQQFRQWQDDYGNPQEDTKPQPVFDTDTSDPDGVLNSMTRLPDMNAVQQQSLLQEEEERSSVGQMPITDSRDGLVTEGASSLDSTFLSPGDLVEVEYVSSERNSTLAVFIQRIPGSESQFFTMQGRWLFMREKQVMWSIPGWASKSELEPLMEHLPLPGDQTELEEVKERAHVEDLSVPRSASAPLVKRLVKFWTETQEIYRKHASVLDDAHNLLAHETDLRYGSLVSAASTLLQIPARELPITALYAVRTALSRAPVAFNIDRRSHRMTGYLQIRSKEQVRMVRYVRDWLRDWQDDIAKRAQLGANSDSKASRSHRTSRGAQYIYSFLEKARSIVLKSRDDRQVLPLKCNNIGISQKRFPIDGGEQAIRVTQNKEFTEQDIEIVRFIEAWCASGMLYMVNAYAALPPMILQATGLYDQFESLDQGIGFVFLQELGVMMPYENRIRFDPHLLLPSSQHSKPLQNLMDNLIKMQKNHNFVDSMQELRRDWGSTPVYCVDDADAQEIDDGVSIESVEGKEGEHWLHAHVANPTAFFERDHPLAKMARHMGESIYMPERAYMMMPRWASSRHFSLAKDRPCITFSTRVDSNAKVLERKVAPGIIRSVISLTYTEVTDILGEKDPRAERLVLTVGGEAPEEAIPQSMAGNVTEDMVHSLRTMRKLADKLYQKRLDRGGLFFHNQDNDISVWQNNKQQGLAWDHPWRRGSRTVEGDPIIQLKTAGFTNWFAPKITAGVSMIREMMLLAGETASTWCADRGIPSIFRGTVARPDAPDADAFYRDVIAPAVQEHGEIPPYLGVRYFGMQGNTQLRSTPLPHKSSGLEQYVKTTSPLRRYGDMIVHWQIEAALREEARRGRSLTPQDTAKDSSFLPFSANVLNTIMLGLHPRENLITRSKAYSRDFWMNLLLFRALHFQECELPFAATIAESLSTGKPLLQLFLNVQNTTITYVSGTATTLNTTVQMWHPTRCGLEEPKRGDTWEVEVELVDVYRRIMVAKPVRLVDRPVDERLERWRHLVP